MKWFIVSITVLLMVFSSILPAKANNELPVLTTMQGVRDFIIDKGENKTATVRIPGGTIHMPYKEFKIGGVGQFGMETFYTFKASEDRTVIIVYKPHSRSYVVLTEEARIRLGKDSGFSMYIVTDNGGISWSQEVESRMDMDVFVKTFLQALPSLLINQFDYCPSPEDRSDLCWELKAK